MELLMIIFRFLALSIVTLGVVGLMACMVGERIDKAYSTRAKWHLTALKITGFITRKCWVLYEILVFITAICGLIFLWDLGLGFVL